MAIRKKHLHFTFCHKKPERSFFRKGEQFPVCARCTGIHIGYITFPIFHFQVFTLNIWWSIVLIIPTFIDGWTQAFFNRESTNLLRLITGLFAGIGMMSLVAIIGQFLGIEILQLIHYLK